LRSLVLSAIYFYTFRQLGFGVKKLFHFTLLALSLLYLQSAFAYVYLATRAGAVPFRMAYMDYVGYYDLALKTMLAFSAMAMWIENQSDRLAQIGKELDRARRKATKEQSLDYLTGLLNQDSLRRRFDSGELFTGVAVVCDMDDFKSINDRLGHVVGDEVLRNVGNLIRSSIRAEDLAYRWGGDEFAILFEEQGMQLARTRMLAVEARLHNFQIRGHGSMDIQFSWGAAEGASCGFREILDQADREMYALKQQRHGRGSNAGTAKLNVPGSVVGDPHGYGTAE
jgi:diguanylate cyclase (GGDEF)-like protein